MSGEYIEMSGNISLHPDGKNPDINSVRLEGESNMIMNVDELNVDDDNTQRNNMNHSTSRRASLESKSGGLFRCLVSYFDAPTYVPDIYIYDQFEDDIRTYNLGSIQRFFMTFEDPNCSTIGRVINVITIATIVLSVASFIIASSPSFQYFPDSCEEPICDGTCNDSTCHADRNYCDGEIKCPPVENDQFATVEFVCIMIFTVEYLSRLSTCWSVPARLAGLVPEGWDDAWIEITLDEEIDDSITPEQRHIRKSKLKATVKEEPIYSPPYQIAKYMWQPFNLIDLGAILPWYLTSFGATIFSSSGGILRVLRIMRVFRVFKLGRRNKSVELLTRTLSASTSVLMLLIFFFVLAVVVFGALIFFLESGDFKVTEEHPNGMYYRQHPVTFELEESPFTSMISSFYFAVITLATTGYGELTPYSDLGRFFSNVCMLTGVLMVALPISVVGSNFTTEYNTVHGEDTDSDYIYSCLLELINNDEWDEATGELKNYESDKARKLSALGAIISCLDSIKHRKLKKHLMSLLDTGETELVTLNNESRTSKPSDSRDDTEEEKRMRLMSRALDQLQIILDGTESNYDVNNGVNVGNKKDGYYGDFKSGREESKYSLNTIDKSGRKTKSPKKNKNANSIDDQSDAMYYLYRETKEITVLNEDKQWLDMIAGEMGKTQMIIDRPPLDTVQDLVSRMQELYMEHEAANKQLQQQLTFSNRSSINQQGVPWFKTAIEKPEVQALALETAELQLVDLSRVPPADQHTFFLCTYTLLCIHAAAACKIPIDTIVQKYPERVGYQMGKRIYTLAEIYDLGGGNIRPPSNSKS